MLLVVPSDLFRFLINQIFLAELNFKAMPTAVRISVGQFIDVVKDDILNQGQLCAYLEKHSLVYCLFRVSFILSSSIIRRDFDI